MSLYHNFDRLGYCFICQEEINSLAPFVGVAEYRAVACEKPAERCVMGMLTNLGYVSHIACWNRLEALIEKHKEELNVLAQ